MPLAPPLLLLLLLLWPTPTAVTQATPAPTPTPTTSARIVVDSLDDSGPGTLRAALEQVAIRASLPSPPPTLIFIDRLATATSHSPSSPPGRRITLLSPLPAIRTANVTLYGNDVTIDGSALAASSASGLVVQACGVHLSKLFLSRFPNRSALSLLPSTSPSPASLSSPCTITVVNITFENNTGPGLVFLPSPPSSSPTPPSPSSPSPNIELRITSSLFRFNRGPGIAIQAPHLLARLEISACIVHNNNADGIYVGSIDHVLPVATAPLLLTNNYALNNVGHGIMVTRVMNALMSDNLARGNTASGLAVHGAAAVVSNNLAAFNGYGGVQVSLREDMPPPGADPPFSRNSTVLANTAHSNQYGIVVSTSDTLVLSNTVGLSADETQLLGNNLAAIIVFPSARNSLIANNTACASAQYGIIVNGAATRLEHNFVGVTRAGMPAGSRLDGINIYNLGNPLGARGVVVGPGNTVAANGGMGVAVVTQGATVTGNIVGLSPNQSLPLGNTDIGIGLFVISSDTLVTSNVVCGGKSFGIVCNGRRNRIEHNRVGVSASGQPFPNAGTGINVFHLGDLANGHSNTVGPGNIVCSNTLDGLSVSGLNNTVAGNFVGYDPLTDRVLGNQNMGVFVDEDSANTLVTNNTIVDSGVNGVMVRGSDVHISHNVVGMTPSGRAAGNHNDGINLHNKDRPDLARNVVVGPNNVVVFNRNDGVAAGTVGATIVNNTIGLTANHTQPAGNARFGITIPDNASAILVRHNVVCSSGDTGILLFGSNSTVTANSIGISPAGHVLPNAVDGISTHSRGKPLAAMHNTIGPGNVVAGHPRDGIISTSAHTLIFANIVGLFHNQSRAAGNGRHGISAATGSDGSQVLSNVVCASGAGGLAVNGNGVLVESNLVGVSQTGLVAGNGGDGVNVFNLFSPDYARHCVVRGNVVVASTRDGISAAAADTQFFHNAVGFLPPHDWPDLGSSPRPSISTASALPLPSGNARYGIAVDRSAVNTHVFNNTVAAAVSYAVGVFGTTAVVSGNRIGLVQTSSDSYFPVANQAVGMFVSQSGRSVTVGPANVIGASGADGILISALDTSVADNWVGITPTRKVVGNRGHGIRIDSNGTDFYGQRTTIGPGNTIAYNSLSGVCVSARNNTIHLNFVQNNSQSGVFIDTPAAETVVASNFIRNNNEHGVLIHGRQTRVENNGIAGNSGGDGVHISNQLNSALALGNIVGPGNRIYGNRGSGVVVAADGVHVQSNIIGLALDLGSLEPRNGPQGTIANTLHGIVTSIHTINASITDNSVCGNGGHGILLSGSAALVTSNTAAQNSLDGIRADNQGVATLATRNIISANRLLANEGAGVSVGAASTIVEENDLGISKSGAMFGNRGSGVSVGDGSSSVDIVANIVLASGLHGIFVNGSTTSINIAANMVGVTIDGVAGGNAGTGILVDNAGVPANARNTRIHLNFAANNRGDGISVAAVEPVVAFNIVGISPFRDTPMGNVQNGVVAALGSQHALIEDNTVVHSGDGGVHVAGTAATVRRNFVGVTPGGGAAGNVGPGVHLDNGGDPALATHCIVEDNVIAANLDSNIVVDAHWAVVRGNTVGLAPNMSAALAVGPGGTDNGIVATTLARDVLVSNNTVCAASVAGILVNGNRVTVEHCLVGVTPSGMVFGNTVDGIQVFNNNSATLALNVTIGPGNTIAGNVRDGLFVGATGTLVVDNIFGRRILPDGTSITPGNGRLNIHLWESSDSTVVRGNSLIAASLHGMFVNCRRAVVEENFIDTSKEHGIFVNTDSEDTLIAGNQILRSGLNAIIVSGMRTTIRDNSIGTISTDPRPFGQGLHGVYLNAVSVNTTVTGNVICDSVHGIVVLGSSVRIVDNRIGVSHRNLPMGNTLDGVHVFNNAKASLARDVVVGPGNVVANNGQDGVAVRASGTLVIGNAVGLDATQSRSMGNGRHGINITVASDSVLVGNNTLCSNNGAGILASSLLGVRLEHNRIGLTPDNRLLPNGRQGISMVLGGETIPDRYQTPGVVVNPLLVTVGPGNVVVGGSGDGIAAVAREAVWALTLGATVKISDNLVGVFRHANGSVLAAGNGGCGVNITGDGLVRFRVVGNVIGASGAHGMRSSGSVNVNISANYIGVDSLDSAAACGNKQHGVFVATDNAVIQANVLSSNGGDGVQLVGSLGTVRSNLIGLLPDGKTAAGNGGLGLGVDLSNSGRDVLIEDNSVCNNPGGGISVVGSTASAIVLRRNRVGVAADQSLAGNGEDGVRIFNLGSAGQGPRVVIGPRNIIGGNLGHGLLLATTGAQVLDNLIGNDGETRLPNQLNGITLVSTSSGTLVQGNVLSGNVGSGVLDFGKNNRLEYCTIGADASGFGCLGNGQSGVQLAQASVNTSVRFCHISCNSGDGVAVAGRDTLLAENLIGPALNGSRDAKAPWVPLEGSGAGGGGGSTSSGMRRGCGNLGVGVRLQLSARDWVLTNNDVRYNDGGNVEQVIETASPTLAPTGVPTAVPTASVAAASSSSSSLLPVVAGVVVALVVLVALAFGALFVSRRRRDAQQRKELLGELADLLQVPALRAREEYVTKFASVLGSSEQCDAHLAALAVDSAALQISSPPVVLGEGEQGRVLLATLQRREGAPCEVAVKMLHEGSFSGRECVNLLLECRVMAMLPPHPHVVELLGLHIHQAPVMVALAFIAEGNLRDFLRRQGPGGTADQQALPGAVLVSFAWQVAQAVAFLHQHMLIHRDLAARNVLVGRRLSSSGGGDGADYSLKLSDLGLARRVQGESDYYRCTSDGREPIRWMCPLAIRLKRFTRKSDVWSFGVLCWEMFSYAQSKPYADLLAAEVLDRVTAGLRLARPPQCPLPVYAVLERCWATSQPLRPAMAQVEIELEALVSAEERTRDAADAVALGRRRAAERAQASNGADNGTAKRQPLLARLAWGSGPGDEGIEMQSWGGTGTIPRSRERAKDEIEL